MKKALFCFLCMCVFFFTAAVGGQEPDIEGIWEGTIEIMGQKLEFSVHFVAEGKTLKGSMDIPAQGVKGLALKDVVYEKPGISFKLETPQATAYFEGKKQGDDISGRFEQAGISGDFILSRAPLETEQKKEEQKEPPPYCIEEVTFENGDIKFTGELMRPKKEGKHPALIMITGSGPQNRYEELFGWKIFQDIADHFTRNGIAVLLYDDRGTGGSSGNVFDATTRDFAADALAALEYLQTRKDINPAQIGLCGHSEGGIVAPLAASISNEVAFIVLISGTGLIGEKIILAQNELIARAEGTEEEKIRKNLENSKKIFDLLHRGEPLENLEEVFEEMAAERLESMDEAQKKNVTDPEKFLTSQTEGLKKQFTSTWFQYFLSYDPVPALKKVRCPVLLLFGELDLQVPAEMNKKAMVSALKEGGNKDFKAKIFPKANHLFQEAKTGSPSEYAKLPEEFVPGFLDFMTAWILEHVDTVK